MTSLDVSMPEKLRRFIDERCREGGAYSTPSEYIRELVRKDMEQQAQQRLESLLIEGLDSGEPSSMTPEDWSEIRRTARDRCGRYVGFGGT